MATRALLLLLLTPLLRGSVARPAPRRASRHSDGTFTSEFSRLRERARLQRLLQGLVGKRSEQDTESSPSRTRSTEGPLCLLWPNVPTLHARAPLAPGGQAWSPGLRSAVVVSDPATPAEAWMRRRG